MNVLNFVAVCVGLLMLTVAAPFAGEAMKTVNKEALAGSRRTEGDDDRGLEYLFFERLWWSVLYRVASRAVLTAIVIVFCVLVAWLAWSTQHWMGPPWQVAYLALACGGLSLLNLPTDHNTPARRLLIGFVALSMVWMFLHVAGLTHVSIPAIRFTIP